jgi:hypothetical protein
MINRLKNHLATSFITLLCFMLNLVIVSPANAVDSWSIGVTPQVLMTQYSDSTLRDTMLAYGLYAKADYLEKGAITAGYNFTTVEGKAGNPNIDESSWYLSGRFVRFSDSLAGKLGFRLDGYAITDQTKIKSTEIGTGMGRRPGDTVTTTKTLSDDINVVYGQLDYMNYADKFYADIGYALSDYNYEQSVDFYTPQDNKVYQFTIAAGLAINNRYDWLQTRIYFINLDHGNNTDGVKQSNAAEFKWLHWFKPNALLNTHSSVIKLLAGKRLFPVDPDSAATYSIADLQTSSVSVGLDWKVGEQNKFLLLVGYDRYENLVINDKYSTRYLFGSLTLNW